MVMKYEYSVSAEMYSELMKKPKNKQVILKFFIITTLLICHSHSGVPFWEGVSNITPGESEAREEHKAETR